MRAAIAGALAGLALVVALVSSASSGSAQPASTRSGCDVCAALAPAGGR